MSELVDLCVDFIGEAGDAIRQQLDSAEIYASSARVALRPDGLWFVLFPFDAPGVDSALEGGCLITQDGNHEGAWDRVAPAQDDFAEWADGTLPNKDA